MSSKRIERKSDKTGGGWRVAVGVGLLIGILVMVAEGWSEFSSRKFDGKTRFTRLMVCNESVSIWSFDPLGSQEVLKVMLPGELEVITIGRGKWMVKSMPELGRKYGWDWFTDSISAFLGVPITTVSEAEGFWDKAMWWWQTRDKQVEEVEMAETGWVTDRMALDGQRNFDLTQAWQAKTEELFFSSVIASAGWKLAVFNPTGIPGLGAKLARIAETQGFKVVVLAQNDEGFDNCVVKSQMETRSSVGVDWLIEYFGCDWKEGKQMDGDEAELTVGSKFSKWGD